MAALIRHRCLHQPRHRWELLEEALVAGITSGQDEEDHLGPGRRGARSGDWRRARRERQAADACDPDQAMKGTVTDESVKWTGKNVLPSRPQAYSGSVWSIKLAKRLAQMQHVPMIVNVPALMQLSFLLSSDRREDRI
jgi:hypothetical protein